MDYVNGVNLLPSTGEWSYDTIRHDLITQWTQSGSVWTPNLTTTQVDNYFSESPGGISDYSNAIDQLQAQFPDCTTVALVIAWFGNSTDITACQICPSTNHNGSMYLPQLAGSPTKYTTWTVSSLFGSNPLTYNGSGQITTPPTPFPGIIPITKPDGVHNVYGGTPSDQSVVRCIQDLKRRGLRVVFYPFILMDILDQYPWRGRITYLGADVSSAATTAVDNFLGLAATSQFTPDATNLTVAYSGSPTDFTYRRMILHYANLCVVAGGVDLFLLGSELRGIETIRGPGWTPAGTTGGDGRVTWDYPFVNGLMQLADDVRSVFDGAGLYKDLSGLHNLICYSADWSDWMGFQHPGENGQWPHLDQLFGHDNIDLVSLDNYMPLSDWTTGTDGLDPLYWSEPAPDPSAWPPSSSTMNGLGLTGTPTLTSIAYLKANIEGGEKFNWFYNDSANAGIGLDPNGTDLRVSLPEGDRLAQARNPYYPNQQLLANKQVRWWWNNQHQAIYDDGDGSGWSPHGPYTEWVPNSKSIIFAEYGICATDRGTNQPNVFYDPKSVESFTAYWSIWDPAEGDVYLPRRDDEIQLLGLQAIYEYWFVDGNNMTVGGVPMLQPAFMSIWNWDARPFPTFPAANTTWGDASNWPTGQWLGGKGPFLTPLVADTPPAPGSYPAFPTLNGQGWSVHYRPSFTTGLAEHVSGRQSRAAKMSTPVYEIELSFDILRMESPYTDLQTIAGFFDEMAGQDGVFTFPAPAELGLGSSFNCRFADDSEDLEEFLDMLFRLQSLKLRTVK